MSVGWIVPPARVDLDAAVRSAFEGLTWGVVPGSVTDTGWVAMVPDSYDVRRRRRERMARVLKRWRMKAS